MANVQFIDHSNEVMLAISGDTIEKLNQAGDLIRDAMKAQCPTRTGALKKSIRVQRLPKEQPVKIIAGSKKAWYVHIVLFGSFISGVRYTGKRTGKIGKKVFRSGGHSTGIMPPNNFMLRALDMNMDRLRTLFGKPISTGVFTRGK